MFQVPGWLGWSTIILVGALILCPAVAYFGFDPLPGDFSFNVGNTRIYMPFATSLIVSVSLALLFRLFSK